MPLLILTTEINNKREIVFDLARSLDLHLITSAHTGEKAIAGKTSGLIGLNETVTWKARHFGIWQTLTSKITEYKYPEYFTDEMTKGIFAMLKHQHRFEEVNGITLMTDSFLYTAPFGGLGRIADSLFLTKYLHKFIAERNAHIKDYAETEKWREILERS